jgi:hypothetical protein
MRPIAQSRSGVNHDRRELVIMSDPDATESDLFWAEPFI